MNENNEMNEMNETTKAAIEEAEKMDNDSEALTFDSIEELMEDLVK